MTHASESPADPDGHGPSQPTPTDPHVPANQAGQAEPTAAPPPAPHARPRRRGRRLIAIAAIAVLMVVAAAAVVALLAIDTLARQGIERGATYALDVPTTLQGADVGLLRGTIALSDLKVANPEGFDQPHFLALRTASADADVASIFGDTIEVQSLTLQGIDLRLERSARGANYRVILDNLERFETGQKPEPSPDASGKQLVIRILTIRDVQVHVDALPVDGALGELASAKVRVPEIVLHDVGQADRPVSMAELAAVVLKAVLASAVDVGADVLPADVLGELQTQLSAMLGLDEMGVGGIDGLGQAAADLLGVPLQDAAQDAIDQAQDAAEDAARDAADAIQQAAEQAQEQAKEQARRAQEKLKGLLPGRSDRPRQDEPAQDPG